MLLSIDFGAIHLNFAPFMFGVYLPNINLNGNILCLGEFVIDKEFKEFEIDVLYFLNHKCKRSFFYVDLDPLIFKIDLFFIDSVIKKKL